MISREICLHVKLMFSWKTQLYSQKGFSCAGHCGDEFACSCDRNCIDRGNCCEDFVAECPELYVLLQGTARTIHATL